MEVLHRVFGKAEFNCHQSANVSLQDGPSADSSQVPVSHTFAEKIHAQVTEISVFVGVRYRFRARSGTGDRYCRFSAPPRYPLIPWPCASPFRQSLCSFPPFHSLAHHALFTFTFVFALTFPPTAVSFTFLFNPRPLVRFRQLDFHRQYPSRWRRFCSPNPLLTTLTIWKEGTREVTTRNPNANLVMNP